MKKRYSVFKISTRREIYGVGDYYVLGDAMYSADTKQDAVEYIDMLNTNGRYELTILEMYATEKDTIKS